MTATPERTRTETRVAIVSLAVLMLGAGSSQAYADSGATKTGDAQVARGAVLVKLGGCNDCHTPVKLGPNGPEPDLTRLLSGHPEAMVLPRPPHLPPGPWVVTVAATNTAWAGPWGVSFTANLTPDKQTGLGLWTPRTFIDTLRSGRHLGRGRPILPPMPAQTLGGLGDEDLRAIFAYLQSVPAVSNHVPQPIPPTAAVTSAKR